LSNGQRWAGHEFTGIAFHRWMTPDAYRDELLELIREVT
jgi:hypothetical protein